MALKSVVFKKTGVVLFTWIFLSAFIVLWTGITAYAREGANSREWKETLEAANREGSVVIAGVPGEGWRKSMVDLFQQEYPQIKVEYSTTPGRAMLPRIRKERELGKKLWDLNTGGFGTTILMKEAGFFSPIRPLLLPEIADDKKWIGGINSLFSDKENKYLLAYLMYVQPSIFVNREFIKEPDLKTADQLLDPKFKGKIVILNPRGGTSRQALLHLGFIYGENFIRDLLTKHDVAITDDNRQQTDWLVRGKYPISVGLSATLLIPFHKQGLGKQIMEVEDKITRTTTGSGLICLFEGAPHPNAAKVYLNWLLSQKAQAQLTKNIEHNSRRLDVPPVETPIDLNNLSKYRSQDTEEGSEAVARFDAVIKEVMKH